MGYAARLNPNSNWNKNRNKSVVQAPTPRQEGEPVVIELSLKTIWGFICHRLNPSRQSQSPAPIS